MSEQWATIDLMGHAQTAGRVAFENGFIRVDVPTGADDQYTTEYYGMSAIYSIKIVGREIALAYAKRSRSVVAYDEPIVTREQHTSVVNRLERQRREMVERIAELEKRLTAVNALPAPRQLFDDLECDVEGDE